MDVRDLVRGHYGAAGLGDAVVAALSSAGVATDNLRAPDLFPVDQLHAGGAIASEHVLDRAGVGAGVRLLDVGSGLGGLARMAAMRGADVTGVDITPELVDAATDLTARTGLADCVRFCVTTGDALPFDDDSFDAAVMIHVGMNVADKKSLFDEINRVLTAEGRFTLYEEVSTASGDPPYPLPWAIDARFSFLETLEDYCAHLQAARFEVTHVEDRTQAVLGPRPAAAIGPADVFGPEYVEQARNFLAAARAGLLRPVIIMATSAR